MGLYGFVARFNADLVRPIANQPQLVRGMREIGQFALVERFRQAEICNSKRYADVLCLHVKCVVTVEQLGV